MNRLPLVLAIILALVPTATAVEFGLGQMLYTSNAPTLDGQADADEWTSPATEIISSVSDPTPVIASGSFSGQADLSILLTGLFTTDQIYLHVDVTDDLARAGDTLTLEVGAAVFTIQDGVATSGPSGDWEVVKHPTNPWGLEIRIAATVVGVSPLAGAFVPFNLRFADDDDGADGVMERGQTGAGALLPVDPRNDLLAVATMLEMLAPTFSDVGNLAKRASRLRKAADVKRWADDFTLESKSEAAKSLDRVRNVIRKLEKYRAKADASIAFQLDQPMEALLRAMRMAAARLHLLGLQTPGSDMTKAAERMWRGETAAAAGDWATAAKQYRKAAKKAASQVY